MFGGHATTSQKCSSALQGLHTKISQFLHSIDAGLVWVRLEIAQDGILCLPDFPLQNDLAALLRFFNWLFVKKGSDPNTLAQM